MIRSLSSLERWAIIFQLNKCLCHHVMLPKRFQWQTPVIIWWVSYFTGSKTIMSLRLWKASIFVIASMIDSSHEKVTSRRLNHSLLTLNINIQFQAPWFLLFQLQLQVRAQIFESVGGSVDLQDKHKEDSCLLRAGNQNRDFWGSSAAPRKPGKLFWGWTSQSSFDTFLGSAFLEGLANREDFGQPNNRFLSDWNVHPIECHLSLVFTSSAR